MSFLKRAFRDAVSQGVRKGIGDAIGKAVQQTVEPRVTQYANETAQRIDKAADNAARHAAESTAGLEGAFANLGRSVQNYADLVSRDLKVCPQCGQPASADTKFCPGCGGKLPEQTLGQGAVCPACGKQNSVGMKYCADCGTMLPAAAAEAQALESRNAQVMQQWEQMLPQYPKWNCGGRELYIDDYDSYICFRASFSGNDQAARQAVEQYRQLLQQNGFRPAGEYPTVEQLYKRIDGVVYRVDTEHCFDGDSDCPSIGFDRSEPRGGFDYVKPEPRKKTSLKDLFRF